MNMSGGATAMVNFVGSTLSRARGEVCRLTFPSRRLTLTPLRGPSPDTSAPRTAPPRRSEATSTPSPGSQACLGRSTGCPGAVDAIHREHVESYIEDQLARHKPSTALVRYKSLQQFFRWCVDEGEIVSSPMERMKPPKVSSTPPDVLKPAEVKSLLDACAGAAFEDRRDTAIDHPALRHGVEGFRSS